MARETIRQISLALQRWLGSKAAFVTTLGIFLVHAIWLAFTAIYPLPFDEYYHYGIIKIYAQQWSPFITQQPAEASLYGDITRYPSYLYHYLMSFPYRLFEEIIPSEEGRIITLRLFNIGLFAIGLWLFRRLLLRAKVSPRIIHAALLFFAITPIVPFVAAHINYDNVLVIATPLTLLLGYRVLESAKLQVRPLLSLLIVGLLGCLAKETFMPIFGFIALYIGVVLIWRHRRSLLPSIFQAFQREGYHWRIVVTVLLLLSVGLFAERYLVNQARYGNYGPECDKVQTIETCSDYMPWYRNYQNKLHPAPELEYGNPVSFTQHWGSKIMRGFYAIFQHTPTQVVSDKEPFGPIVLKPLLPIPIVLASIVAVASGAIVTLNLRRLWARPAYRYFLVVTAGYVASVWLFNYVSYLDLRAAQAIQARYFLPLLPVVLTIILQAYAWLIRSRNLRTVLLVTVGCLYIYTGGVLGWLIRADTTWYWQNQFLIETNQTVQEQLKKVIIH